MAEAAKGGIGYPRILLLPVTFPVVYLNTSFGYSIQLGAKPQCELSYLGWGYGEEILGKYSTLWCHNIVPLPLFGWAITATC